LFYSTQIPACLWFLARDKKNHRFRDRRGETLFIDARGFGRMLDRVHAELTEVEIQKIANTYRAWRGNKDASNFSDIPGFAKSASLTDIRAHRYVLVPGRYVGFDSRPTASWDRQGLEKELTEILARFQQADRASASALVVLKELLHG
jgi:type I restriction enzyme M protein